MSSVIARDIAPPAKVDDGAIAALETVTAKVEAEVARKCDGSPTSAVASRTQSNRSLTRQLSEVGPIVKVWPLMIAVTVLGTLNNFTGRISARVLGRYNGLVGGVLSATTYMGFNCIALSVQACRGRPIKAQLRDVLYGIRGEAGWQYWRWGVWKFLVLAGISDVFNDITGLVAQPYLSTLMFSLMNQACVPFTVLFSLLMIARRYTALEIFSVAVVGSAAVSGALIQNASTQLDDNMFWATFTAATTSFAALSFVLKEKSFLAHDEEITVNSARGRLKRGNSGGLKVYLMQEDTEPEEVLEEEEQLDVFVVSSIVAIVGFVFVTPVGLFVHHLTSKEPTWPAFVEGFHFLYNSNEAKLAFLVYAITNVCFNVALLSLTGYASALLSFMSLKLSVPATAILSPLPWPVIGSKIVTRTQWWVLSIMAVGITAFRCGNLQNKLLKKEERPVCCFPFCG